MNDSNMFVGRRDALDAFYLRFAYRHMKNGIYYCGNGGIGKTKILKRIFEENQNDPIRVVTPVIDFYDTQNHSVRGLQSAIKKNLQNDQAFQRYEEMLKQIEVAKSKQELQPSAISSSEVHADKVFVECCAEAIVGREVILLFDTFERVQQRYVGQWLCQEFLPNVGDLIVAIAGRPEPVPARMPDNVLTFELEGLDSKSFASLVHSRLPSVTNEMVDRIWRHSGGSPLIAHLILDLREPDRSEFLSGLMKLGESERIQESSELQIWLVSQFVRAFDDRHNIINRIIWAMAYLRRRFDVAILKYIVENTSWFKPNEYETIFNDLRQLIYIKEYPLQQGHLLHDEIQRMVAKFVLPEVGIWDDFRSDLYEKVVNLYYPKTIDNIEKTQQPDKSLAVQMRAEQLGYILDHNINDGLRLYEMYRGEVGEKTQDYDFEELLWGEVREHLAGWNEDESYDISRKRGQWLRKHGLFQKAETHYKQMFALFNIKQVEIQQALGFMLMRQGKVAEAIEVFKSSRSTVKEDDFRTITTIENNLGQAARAAGKWDDALDHYAKSFYAATIVNNQLGMANVYINRGYLYSLKGEYSEAKKQCGNALDLLDSLPVDEYEPSAIYAWMNLGTAYRHSGDYSIALQHYNKSLDLAEKRADQESICNILQHIGITEHLWGRTLRRDGKKFDEACDHQIQALQKMINALEIAQRSDWRKAIADGLNRLGKVYREIYRLQTLIANDKMYEKKLDVLSEQALSYQPPFEIEYEYDFLTTKRFKDSNWLEKAARLFEISALVADQVNDFHRTLESWTGTAKLFEELGMDDKVPLVLDRIEYIKGYDYQESLFGAISEIISADIDFKQQKLDKAMEKYKNAFADLADQPGYARYVLADHLRDIEWRIQTLEPATALSWCNSLEREWSNRSVLQQRPEMRDTLERIRFDAIRRQMKT